MSTFLFVFFLCLMVFHLIACPTETEEESLPDTSPKPTDATDAGSDETPPAQTDAPPPTVGHVAAAVADHISCALSTRPTVDLAPA